MAGAQTEELPATSNVMRNGAQFRGWQNIYSTKAYMTILYACAYPIAINCVNAPKHIFGHIVHKAAQAYQGELDKTALENHGG